MTNNNKTQDFQDASAPEDVVRILRNAAEAFGEAQCELDSAWQKSNGDVWQWMQKRFESFAAQLEREMPKHY